MFETQTLEIRKVSSGGRTHYKDLRFLLPTPNICERLFPKSGHALNDHGMAMLPCVIEAQWFLRPNRYLWSAKDFTALPDQHEQNRKNNAGLSIVMGSARK